MQHVKGVPSHQIYSLKQLVFNGIHVSHTTINVEREGYVYIESLNIDGGKPRIYSRTSANSNVALCPYFRSNNK